MTWSLYRELCKVAASGTSIWRPSLKAAAYVSHAIDYVSRLRIICQEDLIKRSVVGRENLLSAKPDSVSFSYRWLHTLLSSHNKETMQVFSHAGNHQWLVVPYKLPLKIVFNFISTQKYALRGLDHDSGPI